MIDKANGQVAYVVMSFGGFLGMGADTESLPWDTLEYDLKYKRQPIVAMTRHGKHSTGCFLCVTISDCSPKNTIQRRGASREFSAGAEPSRPGADGTFTLRAGHPTRRIKRTWQQQPGIPNRFPEVGI